MKYLVLLAFTISSFVLTAQSNIPSVEVKTLSGETVNIQDYTTNGKITVLSFWATWCSPCKRELDAIADVYEEWQEEYDAELIAITIDDARALPKVKPMVQAKRWDYTILSDVKQDLMRGLNFQNVPMTL